MNRITKSFIVAVLSTVATSTAIYANYPSSAPGQYPSGAQQGYGYADQPYYDQAPDMGAEGSFMRGSDQRFGRMRQDNRNMYLQDRTMMREGYDANEAYYNAPAPSYSGRPQGQMMRGGYQQAQGGYYNAGYEAGAPQSYPIDENYPNAPRGSKNYRGQYQGPRGSYTREDGHEIKHDGDEQHPVYEYMLGKDGKWHSVPNPSRYSNAGYGNYNEVGYNDQDSSRRNGNMGDKMSPESYPIDENYPNAPRNDNRSMQKDAAGNRSNPTAYNQWSSYNSDPELMGDASSSYNMNRNPSSNPNASWGSDEDPRDQSNLNTGSSSTTKRNTKR
jgi:hypothetical protein